MHFNDEFKDKSVIVTGAAGGIGKETALRFAAAGAKVAVCDVKTRQGKQTADEITKLRGTAFFQELDVADSKAAARAAEKTAEKFGGIDILVNCAGISGSGLRNISKTEDAEWDVTYRVNLKGTANCCKAVYGYLKEQKHGKIINVSSAAGRMPAPGMTPYAASKAAVLNLTRSLASEMAKYSVNVNAVCPGWIWTPIYSDSGPFQQYAEKFGSTPREVFLGMVKNYCPLQREQTVEDIANAILFLASEAAKNITGQAINVDGGAVMS